MRKIPDLPKRYKLLIKLSALLGRASIGRALIYYMSGIDIRSKQILCLTGGRICVKIIYGKKVKIMVFSQKVKIALNAVKLLSGLKEGEVYDAKVCAERLGVSARYLEQVLYLLRKSGFISARRGADGGYYLSDKGKACNAGEIIAAVSGSEERGEDFSSIVSAAMDKAAERIDFTPRMQGIYLDNAATTSADREVVEKMLPYFSDIYGNASSLHAMGRRAQNAVDEARERIAACINARPWEIYFTCGGSESDNWAIKGTAYAMKDKGRHIITTSAEHPAVLESCRALEKCGYQVTYLPVNSAGVISLDDLENAIRKDTVLISVMAANNETGAIFDIARAGEIAKSHGITFHTDAVQAAGHLDLDVKAMNADMLSLSGHKFYCPKGVGVLYKRNGVKCERFMDGGEQERGRRAGTLNTPGIVAIGYALEKACNEREENDARIKKMRDAFEGRLLSLVSGITVQSKDNRLSSHSSLTFHGVNGQALLARLDERGVYASAGSACSSGSALLSHVLTAMGLSEEDARSTVRFAFGKFNTMEQALRAADIAAEQVKALRVSDLFAHDKQERKFE